MRAKPLYARILVSMLSILLAVPPGAFAQQPGAPAPFKEEELDQILAPIALYPDPLISQVLMASTYPLEVVLADRFAQQNKDLKGDALTDALEAQSWDPSVKSLVNFPQVLKMMSDKLDWTLKLGNAFLEQQKDVMDSIQRLRARADAAGYLKSNEEQKVITEEKIITIEPASPEVIYIPAYNPTVVYGIWPYPAYPPYYYYPPGYVWLSPFWFAASVGLGVAWGYAWGSCNWHGGDVYINNSRNIHYNNKFDRGKYASQLPAGGQGRWQHNPDHRMGVSYRDQATAQRFNRASTSEAIRSREAFRGRAELGRQELSRTGVAGQGGLGGRGGTPGLGGDRGGAGGRGGAGSRADTGQLGGTGAGVGSRGSGAGSPAGASPRGGAGQLGGSGAGVGSRGGTGGFGGAGSRPSAGQLGGGGAGVGSRGGAFQGIGRGGSAARSASQRGSASRGSFGGGGSRPSGGFGGGGGGRGGGGGGGRRR